MAIKTKKNKQNTHNKTKKVKVMPNLSSSQIKTICKKSYNDFNTFEAEYEKSEKYELVKEKKDVQSELVKLLNQPTSPKDVRPQDDFYNAINYLWLKEITQKKGEEYIVQIDDFRLVQNKVYHEIIDIAKDYIKNNKGSEKAKQISNIYNSYLNFLDDKTAMKHVDQYTTILEGFMLMPPEKGAWQYLGLVNRNEVVAFGLPFVLTIAPDNKNSTIFRCSIAPPQVSLIDIFVYFEDGTDVEYKKSYKRKYFQYINRLFDTIFGKNHKYKAQDVWDCEVELLMAMGCDSIKNDSEEYYNKVMKGDALKKYGFDWVQFSEKFGFKDAPNFFIATSLNYLKCGSEWILSNWGTDKLRSYLVYIYVRQVARFHRNWREIPFEFCGKFMRGQEKIFPKELFPIFGLAFSFNTFLSNEYIARYKNEQAVKYVKSMAEDLKAVFIRKIKRNTWLQPKTKKYALLKLKNFKLEVGSPKVLEKDPLLEYSPTDPWYNVKKIEYWRTKRAISLEGKEVVDIPVIDWGNYPFKFVGTQAYVVNASYTPSKNGIYFPLGYIQKPFIDLDERGIEYNLAYIGYTIGHEMSHSLDDMGSQYDYKGNMNNWWTPEDKKIFKEKQRDVIKQYEEWALRDGIKFDAEPTVGEDLADIAGLSICLEYLRDFQDKNDDIIPVRILSFKALFVYFAYQYRQKMSEKALAAQLKTNPHPPDKYRTNVPLSRLKIFRDLYQVKKGDGMFWHNTDTIW
jgi:putative endopeptidase